MEECIVNDYFSGRKSNRSIDTMERTSYLADRGIHTVVCCADLHANCHFSHRRSECTATRYAEHLRHYYESQRHAQNSLARRLLLAWLNVGRAMATQRLTGLQRLMPSRLGSILLASVCWSCANKVFDILVLLPSIPQFLFLILTTAGYTLLTVWAVRYSAAWAVFVPGHAVVLYTVAVFFHPIEIHSICQLYALMLLFGFTLIYYRESIVE